VDGSKCMQYEGGAGDDDDWPGPTPLTASEDCLFLNVFTSSLTNNSGSTPVPVVVWIYGGGMMAGSVRTYGPVEQLVPLGTPIVPCRVVSGRVVSVSV
jgi:carboxylesterase type B